MKSLVVKILPILFHIVEGKRGSRWITGDRRNYRPLFIDLF